MVEGNCVGSRIIADIGLGGAGCCHSDNVLRDTVGNAEEVGISVSQDGKSAGIGAGILVPVPSLCGCKRPSNVNAASSPNGRVVPILPVPFGEKVVLSRRGKLPVCSHHSRSGWCSKAANSCCTSKTALPAA